MPASVASKSTVTANGYLYVFNGNTVYYAQQNSNGSVGTWTTSSSTLPGSGNADTGTLAYNGYLYVFGGNYKDKVYYAALNASDGSIGAWTTSPNSLPAARSQASVVSANGRAYVIGGLDNSQQVVNTVYYATLNNDGSVGSWTTSSNSLSFSAVGSASLYGDYVYFVGPANQLASTMSNIQRARIMPDGSTSAWMSTNSLPNARGSSFVVTSGDYIYVIGGYEGGSPIATTYYAPINKDGSVGTWSTAGNTLPTALAAGAGVMSKGYIYYIGGYDGTNSKNTVYYSSLKKNSIGGDTIFGGRVSGTSAVSSNEFTTLGQVVNLLSTVGGGDLLSTGNSLGRDISIGTNDGYGLNFKVGGSAVMSISALGVVQIGSASFNSSGEITLSGSARHAKKIMLTAEYAGAVLDAASDTGGAVNCNLNYNGTMTSGFDTGLTGIANKTQSYYQWVSTQSSKQCYDIIVQVPIPADFSAWASSTPLSISVYTSNAANGNINIQARDTAGTIESGCSYVGITPAAGSWATNSASCSISGSYSGGGFMTLSIRTTSASGAIVKVGNISLNYLSKW